MRLFPPNHFLTTELLQQVDVCVDRAYLIDGGEAAEAEAKGRVRHIILHAKGTQHVTKGVEGVEGLNEEDNGWSLV